MHTIASTVTICKITKSVIYASVSLWLTKIILHKLHLLLQCNANCHAEEPFSLIIPYIGLTKTEVY